MCSEDWDADEVFAYNTIKLVRVKDRYLGLLRYFSMLAIFLYIFVFVLIFGKKYLKIEVPVGSVNTSLLKPVHGDAGKFFVDKYPYCSEYNETKYGPPNPFYIKNDTYPCQVWDEYQVMFPPDEPSAMFITTRASIATQQYTCADVTQGCRYPWTEGDKRTYYMAGVESYTIRVQHSFQATQFFRETKDDMYALEASSMMGKMVDLEGNVVKTFGHGMDIVSLEEVLQASGQLLHYNSTNSGATVGESNRHGGMLVFVVITYDNINSDGRDTPSYTFYPTAIPEAQYKVVEPVRLNATWRELYDRHGVKIQFLISGQIGRFDFQVMLIQLVSALGLLSVATLVVEMCMLYIMPHRKYYNKYKFEETIDFSDVRDAEHMGTSADRIHHDLARMRESFIISDVASDRATL